MSMLIMVITVIAYLVNPRLGTLLLLPAAIYYLFITGGSIYERLLKLIVYTTPYYSFSIFGDRQRLSMCIVAVAVLCILLTFSILKRNARIRSNTVIKLLLYLFFLASYFISVVTVSYTLVETVFTTYQLVILAYLVILIPALKNDELSDIDTQALMDLYIRGIRAITIALYIQYVSHTFFGIYLGEVYEYNSERVIYNVYFYAKSVLSLYLAIGMLYYFIEYVNRKKLTHLAWLAFFAGAIMINNSRTGLASFAVCAALYCLRHLKQVVRSVRVTSVLILVGIAGLYIIQYMLDTRGSLSGIADDNGRSEQIIAALQLLPRYPLWGIGGSPADYAMTRLGVTIHNFFFAYLIQFGILGGLAVIILLVSPLLHFEKKNWYLLCCAIIGGLFFANWHNVLYIVPVYIIALMENNQQHHPSLVKY